jgi:hypothetical protein
MTNNTIRTEPIACHFCTVLLGKNLAKHYRKAHGISDFRIRRINMYHACPMPLCRQCKGFNSNACTRCAGSGCQLEIFAGNAVTCPLCKSLCHRDMLLAHLIAKHHDCFLNAEFPPMLPVRSRRPSPQCVPLGELNSGLKRQLEKRKESVWKTLLKREIPVESGTLKVKATRCHECGITIGEHLLGEHVRIIHKRKPESTVCCHECGITIGVHLLGEHVRIIHGRKPKREAPNPKLAKNARLPSLGFFDDQVTSTKPRVSICPRCCGDGGVRGGCRKCDGTGWVPAEMERDVTYKSSQDVLDNSRVSNADYLGNNAGGHFRERDGRIGSIPLHDDYSEEA